MLLSGCALSIQFSKNFNHEDTEFTEFLWILLRVLCVLVVENQKTLPKKHDSAISADLGFHKGKKYLDLKDFLSFVKSFPKDKKGRNRAPSIVFGFGGWRP